MNNKFQFVKEINEYTKKISLNNVIGNELLENIGKELASFLNVLILSIKPKNILELGTGCGYATSVIAQASKDYQNKVTTVEVNKKRLDKTINSLSNYGYKGINFVCEDMITFLKQNDEFYDFIILDANPFLYIEAFLEIKNHQKNKDILLIHDSLIPQMPLAPSELKITMNEFNNFLTNQKEYSIHQIRLGDGFWFCVKN
ncbi:MAG: O-methyltransferase [Clostridia bacterium]